MYTGIVMLCSKFKTNMYIHLSQISLQIYMYVYIHPTVSNRRAMYSLRKDETPEVVPCVKSVSFATRLKRLSEIAKSTLHKQSQTLLKSILTVLAVFNSHAIHSIAINLNKYLK